MWGKIKNFFSFDDSSTTPDIGNLYRYIGSTDSRFAEIIDVKDGWVKFRTVYWTPWSCTKQCHIYAVERNTFLNHYTFYRKNENEN